MMIVTQTLNSTRPYLLRGYYEWIVETSCTPYIVVDTYCDEVYVPQQYIDKDGKIILNISGLAVQNLRMSNTVVEFDARFGGVPMHVYTSVLAIEAIYAKETEQGAIFITSEDDDSLPPPDPSQPTTTTVTKKTTEKRPVTKLKKMPSHLKIVK